MKLFIHLFLILYSVVCFAQTDEVFLLTNRKDAHVLRHDLILEETKELKYNTFVFELDDTGKSVVGLLADAAKRGVKVQLVLDGMGESKGLVNNQAVMGALQKMGVEIKIFNPVLRHPLSVNNRNHQKSLITSRKMIIGGRNTKTDYFDDFIDTEILIKGKEVDAAKAHFESVFNSPEVKSPWILTASAADVAAAEKEILTWADQAKAKSYRIRKLEYMPVNSAKYHADPANIALKKKAGINKQIVAMIDRATTELSILNPYVYVSPEVKEALHQAVKRGVKIRIGTNSKEVTDSVLAGIAWEVRKHELTAMGIDVYESRRYVHAKTIVRDGAEVFIGSFNMDMRSHNLNLENGIFINSKPLAQTIDTHHRRMLRYFMTRINDHKESKVESAAIKAALCIRKGYHKLLTNIAWPHL